MQILPVRAGAFNRQDITVELQQVRQSAFVARYFPMYALLIWITPAGMHPDLGIDPDELSIERLGEELQIRVRAVRLLAAHMVRWFFDLDQWATGADHIAKLRVHDIAKIEDHGLVIIIELVPKHRCEGRGADGAELHRPVRQSLRNLPKGSVLQRTTCQLLTHYSGLIGLLHLPQNLAGAQTVPRHPTPRGITVAADAAETLDWIKEPRFATHGQIEAAIAVRDNIEPRRFLFGDDAGNGVEILFAKQRIDERGLERTTGQAAVKPKRSRVGASDGRGQNHVTGDSEHCGLRRLRLKRQHSRRRSAPLQVVFRKPAWSRTADQRLSLTGP